MWSEKDLHDARKVLKEAIPHAFTRKSVLSEGELMNELIRWSQGQVNIYALRETIRSADELIVKQGQVTTLEVVSKELQLEQLLGSGLGKTAPLCKTKVNFSGLSDEQASAAEFLVQSNDAVAGVKGLSGSGKSKLLTTVVAAIPHDRVYSCAPTKAAAAVLRENISKGSVGTMQGFLCNPRLHRTIKNGVIILDEAGMVGLDDMLAMFQIARKYNAKLILSGDSGQHHSMQRGDALRQLEEGGRYQYRELRTIYRQKDPEYREAVSLAADREAGKALAKLDDLGWISESANCHELAADAYMDALDEKKNVLLIAPGRGDRNLVTSMIRERLHAKGILKKEVSMMSFRTANWTEPQKKCCKQYKHGMSIYFPIPTGVFQAHERVRVRSATNEQVLVDRAGSLMWFDPREHRGFDVGKVEEIKIAPNDRLLLKENRSCSGDEFINGQSVSVESIDSATKEVHLKDGRVLPADYCKYEYDYASTSLKAQGGTVNKVIVAVTNRSGLAVDMRQFYVSIGRGEWSCQTFTDDKEWLRERCQDKADRPFGLGVLADVTREQLQKATQISLGNASTEIIKAVLRSHKERQQHLHGIAMAPEEAHSDPDMDF